MNILWDPTAALAALAGGALIGTAASLLWATLGRVAGISGVLGRLFEGATDYGWRLYFLGGMTLIGVLAFSLPGAPFHPSPRPVPLHIIAGLLVGIGTQVGSGCTSGHGVCGMSRLSIRSLAATLVFMTTGVLSVLLFHLLGGT